LIAKRSKQGIASHKTTMMRKNTVIDDLQTETKAWLYELIDQQQKCYQHQLSDAALHVFVNNVFAATKKAALNKLTRNCINSFITLAQLKLLKHSR
jgi:2C-methyl-D-erythritol 2,4-cyclodiphosphate synthase